MAIQSLEARKVIKGLIEGNNDAFTHRFTAILGKDDPRDSQREPCPLGQCYPGDGLEGVLPSKLKFFEDGKELGPARVLPTRSFTGILGLVLRE